MKKSIFATLVLVGMLSIFCPPGKAEAAWQTTSKGTRYTITQSPGSVSYTHLDVYKRQAQDILCSAV